MEINISPAAQEMINAFVMPDTPKIDPKILEQVERAYRRGYQQGYFFALKDIAEHGDEKANEFLYVDLESWRNKTSVSERVHPPRL